MEFRIRRTSSFAACASRRASLTARARCRCSRTSCFARRARTRSSSQRPTSTSRSPPSSRARTRRRRHHLGAKNLLRASSNAPGDDITLKKADNHWAEIRAGKVTYRIVGMPDRDFPKVPDHREAKYSTVESAVLREMIERTLFSVCNDETRFHLNGVFFESDGSKGAHGLDRRSPPVEGRADDRTAVRSSRRASSSRRRACSRSQGPRDCDRGASSPSRRRTCSSSRRTSRSR